MKALSRILQALAVIGAIVSAGLYFTADQINGVNQGKLDEANSRVRFEQARGNRIEQEHTALKGKLTALEQERDQALAEGAANAAKLTQLQRENEQFLQQAEAYADAQKRLQNENARLGRELAELQAESVNKDIVAEYESKIAQLERRLLELNETRATGTAATAPSESAPSLIGKILTVGKGASFVVLDIGYNNGVRLQNQFTVRHGETPVAKIQVTEVKENLSIARVLPDSMVKTPQSGDSVSSHN